MREWPWFVLLLEYCAAGLASAQPTLGPTSLRPGGGKVPAPAVDVGRSERERDFSKHPKSLR